eukprot:scpid91436/ scgid25109/ 
MTLQGLKFKKRHERTPQLSFAWILLCFLLISEGLRGDVPFVFYCASCSACTPDSKDSKDSTTSSSSRFFHTYQSGLLALAASVVVFQAKSANTLTCHQLASGLLKNARKQSDLFRHSRQTSMVRGVINSHRHGDIP